MAAFADDGLVVRGCPQHDSRRERWLSWWRAREGVCFRFCGKASPLSTLGPAKMARAVLTPVREGPRKETNRTGMGGARMRVLKRGLSPRHHRIAAMLAAGYRRGEVADLFGCHPDSISRFTRSIEFRAAMARVEDRLRSALIEKTAERFVGKISPCPRCNTHHSTPKSSRSRARSSNVVF
jgi:DNA-binding CsgD family transcriptional regulator